MHTHTIAQISHSTYRGENLAQLRNSKSSIFSSFGNGSQLLTTTKFLCKSSPTKIAGTQNKRLGTLYKVSQPDLTNSDGTCWDTPFQNYFKVREGQSAEAANILYSQSPGRRASEEATKAVHDSFLESPEEQAIRDTRGRRGSRSHAHTTPGSSILSSWQA